MTAMMMRRRTKKIKEETENGKEGEKLSGASFAYNLESLYRPSHQPALSRLSIHTFNLPLHAFRTRMSTVAFNLALSTSQTRLRNQFSLALVAGSVFPG